MAKVTLEKVANAERLAVVPFNKNQTDRLRDEERHTLRTFGETVIDVSSMEVFPLNVIQLRGSTRNLAIYPRSGRIHLGRSKRLEIRNERNMEIHIHSEPMKKD